jgi:hypothetical protein
VLLKSFDNRPEWTLRRGGAKPTVEPVPNLVSIITPAFNAAAHLATTIESCLVQTHREFELLIVDDGSTDETAMVARQYAARDGRVRVVSTPNRGMSAARNLAISLSRGSYFALLDSDDLWMPDYLEAQLATLQRNPGADVVTANAINYGGHRDGTPYWPSSTEIRPLTIAEIISREDAVCIMSVFRRRVIERAGLFDERFRGNEDYQFWLRAALTGSQIIADFTPRGYYRRRPDSVSSDERRMLGGIIAVLLETRSQCAVGSAEVRAIDAQLTRFRRELQVAEARHCIAAGDSRGAVAFLKAIPPADRGTMLWLSLLAADVWPLLLSFGYRMKCAFRDLWERLVRRARSVSA